MITTALVCIGLWVLASLGTVEGELYSSPWKLQEFMINLDKTRSIVDSYITQEKERLERIEK